MPFTWPNDFERIPSADWAVSPIGELAQRYDTVETHGWYQNLEPTVQEIGAWLQPNDVLMDYSGGTGIFASRLLAAFPELECGILIVDSSPKFLRLAIEKLGHDPRLAYRLIRYLKEEKRIQLPQEVLEPALLERRVDAIVSTNAIHLYFGLEQTLRAWRDLITGKGRVFIQSGNIGLDTLPEGSWIIDSTVEAIHETAMDLVATDPRWEKYRAYSRDTERMRSYDKLRRKFFLPVRPLAFYLRALEGCSFKIDDVRHETITADVGEWYEFLSAYHEGVLGWIGGSERIEGSAPSELEIEDRLALIRASMDRIFGSQQQFDAIWTYITASPA